MPIGLDFFHFYILVFALSNGHECKCKTAKVHGDRHIKGAKVPWNESSIELSFQGAKRPGSESSRERIGQGPIADSLWGANWPGSEKARYQFNRHYCY